MFYWYTTTILFIYTLSTGTVRLSTCPYLTLYTIHIHHMTLWPTACLLEKHHWWCVYSHILHHQHTQEHYTSGCPQPVMLQQSHSVWHRVFCGVTQPHALSDAAADGKYVMRMKRSPSFKHYYAGFGFDRVKHVWRTN